MNNFEEYSKGIDNSQHLVCRKLCDCINKKLVFSQSKLYHNAPVWFIDENPIVGYSKKKIGISLLFWSGQSFNSIGLKPVGKFKAAEKIYKSIEEINEEELYNWLDESINIQWNYKNIVHNNGKLELI